MTQRKHDSANLGSTRALVFRRFSWRKRQFVSRWVAIGERYTRIV